MDPADQASNHIADCLNIALVHIQNKVVTMNTDSQCDICIDCGIKIPETRLMAVPGAIRCVTCQTFYEGDIR